jgi:hypothetical protein
MPKITRTLTCSYIYTNGTLVQVYHEKRDGVDLCETVDITLGFCTLHVRSKADIWEGFKGHNNKVSLARIVISNYKSDGFLSLAKGGTITATMPSLENGSQNTQGKGIAVQYVTLRTAKGLEFEWTEMPGLICPRFTIQNDSNLCELSDNYYVGGLWSSDRIMKVTDLRPKNQAVAA